MRGERVRDLNMRSRSENAATLGRSVRQAERRDFPRGRIFATNAAHPLNSRS